MNESKIISANQMTIKDDILEKLAFDTRNYQLADYQYEKLMEEISNFESKLDDEHEVALKLASFNESITINVTNIVQHINQLNFLIIAVKKLNPDLPAHRIGFDTNSNT